MLGLALGLGEVRVRVRVRVTRLGSQVLQRVRVRVRVRVTRLSQQYATASFGDGNVVDVIATVARIKGCQSRGHNYMNSNWSHPIIGEILRIYIYKNI